MRESSPSASCSTQTKPRAPSTATRVDELNRRARYRSVWDTTPPRNGAGNIPYEPLLGQIFSNSNYKRIIQRGIELSNQMVASPVRKIALFRKVYVMSGWRIIL
jgi:hypothetical protein